MSNPISGNQYFTKLDDTSVSSNVVNSALLAGRLANLKQVEGTLSPLAAGNYAVVDENGATVQVPPGSLVLHVFYSAPVALVGGTSLQAVLSPTDGGGAGTSLTAVSTLADTNSGNHPAVIPTTGSPATDFYLSAVADGTFTSGVARVRVIYV